jgi:hypothetical protein
MTDSALVTRQRDTTHRQAKRLSEKLKLPQTTAKEILARALYRCAGWKDLQARLDSDTHEQHIEMLTGECQAICGACGRCWLAWAARVPPRPWGYHC